MPITRKSISRAAVAASALLALSGCETTDPVDGNIGVENNSFSAKLKEIGYEPLLMPSSINEPGALVALSTNDDGDTYLEWVGDLASCGVPEEVFEPREGAFPQFGGGKSYDIGLNVLANLNGGATVGGNLGAAKSSTLTVNKAGNEVIPRLLVAAWLTNPLNEEQINPACFSAMKDQKVAIISDVAFIEDGAFGFKDQNGAKINVDAAVLEEIGELGGDIGASAASDGEMSFNERIYVGYKTAFFLPGNSFLGSGGEGLEDATDALGAAIGD